MINFRFHIASLVAVFLALALGIVIGSTVIDRAIVDNLNDRIDRVSGRADREGAENDRLTDEVNQLNAYIEETQAFAVTDELDGVPVVALAVRGIDEAPVTDTVELAQIAGADAPGVLWLEEKFALDDEAAVDELAAIVGQPGEGRRAVRAAAWESIAARLSGSDDSPAGSSDLLSALADAGFVGFEPVGDLPSGFTIDDLPSGGNRALVVGGIGGALSADGTVRPLADALRSAGVPVLVGEVYQEQEGGPDRGAAVVPIRSDDELKAAVSTVDDLDLVRGRVAAVIGLSQLGIGVFGHYGYGTDAGAVMPSPASS